MATRVDRQLRTAPRAAAAVSDALRSDGADNVAVVIGDRRIDLPADLVQALLPTLDDIALGRDVTSAPASLPIGTELAAELLGVSRPWLITMLDRGEIPSTRVGSKRRVRLGDLLSFRRADDERRGRAVSWEFLDEG